MNNAARFRTQMMLKEMIENGEWFTVDALLESMVMKDWGPNHGPTLQAIPTRKELARAIRSAPVWLSFIAPFFELEKRKHSYNEHGFNRTVTWYRFVSNAPDQEEE